MKLLYWSSWRFLTSCQLWRRLLVGGGSYYLPWENKKTLLCPLPLQLPDPPNVCKLYEMNGEEEESIFKRNVVWLMECLLLFIYSVKYCSFWTEFVIGIVDSLKLHFPTSPWLPDLVYTVWQALWALSLLSRILSLFICFCICWYCVPYTTRICYFCLLCLCVCVMFEECIGPAVRWRNIQHFL